MAYIGRDTDKISNVEVLDNITFDGSSSYTLQKGGSNFTPSSANTILLSIDGVVQAGNFTVSGSTIDFGTAVAGTSTCDFILHYGVGLITTPSDGSVTEAKIGTGAVTSTKLASGAVPNQSAFKNIIINGDMSIAQRGTSFTGLGDGGSQYTLDRFKWSEEGATDAAVYTVTQSTDVPSGQGFAKSFKIDCTTEDTSIDANNIQYVGTAIEGQNLQYLKYGTSSAENMVLSFWVKSNKTGTYGVALINNESTEKLYSQTYTISSADTWEKKTLSYVGDTSNGFDNDNGNSLLIQWYLVAGTNKTSGSSQTWGSNTQANRAAGQTVNLADSTSNEWYITGVQLEAGTTASDFEFLPHDVNLERCQRYFISYGGDNSYETFGFGMCYSTTEALVNVPFPTTMRSSPSVSTENLANYASRSGSQAGGAPSSLVNDFSSTKVGNIQLAGLSSMTDKNALRLYTNNSTANRLEFSAEL